jgi:aspartate kinase
MTTRCTDKVKLEELSSSLADIARVEIQPDKCIVAIVGEGMKHTVGLAARACTAIASSDVSLQMISQGASEINITFLVDNAEIPPAVKALHDEFFPVQ